MLPYVAALVAVALLWVYLKWQKTSRFWADRGVPHDKPHPIYGSLTFLQKKNPAHFMIDLRNRFQAKYVGIWLFWRPSLVVNSPELARNILTKHADNFRNRYLGSGPSDPIGALNLFTVNDPTWSWLRRRLTSMFTSAKLKALQGLFVKKSKELVTRIDSGLEAKKDIEIRNMFADYTTDVIGAAAFGLHCDATLTGESPMRTVTKSFMEYSYYRGLNWIAIFFFPELVETFRFRFFPKTAEDYFKKVYKAIVKERGYNPNSEPKDLLDALLKMKHEAIENNEEISDDLVIAQAAVFLQGGFDTSAVMLSYLTYELAFHQEAQEKMYQELLEAKNKLGPDQEFDGAFLSELPYLNAVMKESLRKYPPMGWLDRISEHEYQVDDDLTIPAGTPVYVNAVGMHFDPEFFPEPDKFIPERFLPENMKDNLAFAYMPFGEGPRNCIGMRFAHRAIWYALSTIFLKYKVFPKPNAKKPHEIVAEKNAIFLMPGEDIYVDFVPRN
uniref:unspecific monooxygenase n=1 Tax=Cnaphalocrocis medinalis TaxID=437488 RepID=A0A0C5C563_CNAME|nr:cytochrome P450 monooxygenase CYP324A19 [Cnaphalocrocis medinalis]